MKKIFLFIIILFGFINLYAQKPYVIRPALAIVKGIDTAYVTITDSIRIYGTKPFAGGSSAYDTTYLYSVIVQFSDTNSIIATKADIAGLDTTNLSYRIDTIINGFDTTYLYSVLNTKLALSDSTGSFITPYDTTLAHNWIENYFIKLSDSTGVFVTPYDTTGKWQPLGNYLIPTDTLNLSYRIDTIIIIDTTSLSNRIDLKLNISDTTNKWLPVTFTESDPIYAGDSTNILMFGDTVSILATKYDISSKLNISDTTNLSVASYLTKIYTAPNTFTLKADTSAGKLATKTDLATKVDTATTITNAANGYMTVAGNANNSLRTNLTIAVDTAVAYNGIKSTLATKLTGSIADTQVGFGSGTSLAGNANLIWDNTNKNLKIKGFGGLGLKSILSLINISNDTVFKVRDDGSIFGSALTIDNTTYYNVMAGYEAGKSLTTGSNIVAIGKYALYSNTIYGGHVAIGYEAGYSSNVNDAAGQACTYIGYQAGRNNSGISAVFIGRTSGFNNSGWYNVGIGYNSLYSNTGGLCVAVGTSSLTSLTSGTECVGIGHSTGTNLTTQSYNTLIGAYSGISLTSNNNTLIGNRSGYYITNSTNNIALGKEALFGDASLKLTGNGGNIGIGYQSGYSLTTGEKNIFLGYQAGYNETTGSNKLYIENSNSSSPLIYGDFANDTLRVNGTFQATGTRAIFDSLEVRRENSIIQDDGTITFTASKSGCGTILVDSSGVTLIKMDIRWDADGTTYIDQSIGKAYITTATTDSDGSICFYDGGTSAIFKPRRGYVVRVKVNTIQ